MSRLEDPSKINNDDVNDIENTRLKKYQMFMEEKQVLLSKAYDEILKADSDKVNNGGYFESLIRTFSKLNLSAVFKYENRDTLALLAFLAADILFKRKDPKVYKNLLLLTASFMKAFIDKYKEDDEDYLEMMLRYFEYHYNKSYKKEIQEYVTKSMYECRPVISIDSLRLYEEQDVFHWSNKPGNSNQTVETQDHVKQQTPERENSIESIVGDTEKKPEKPEKQDKTIELSFNTGPAQPNMQPPPQSPTKVSSYEYELEEEITPLDNLFKNPIKDE